MATQKSFLSKVFLLLFEAVAVVEDTLAFLILQTEDKTFYRDDEVVQQESNSCKEILIHREYLEHVYRGCWDRSESRGTMILWNRG